MPFTIKNKREAGRPLGSTTTGFSELEGDDLLVHKNAVLKTHRKKKEGSCSSQEQAAKATPATVRGG